MSLSGADFVQARYCEIVVQDATEWGESIPSNVVCFLESKERRDNYLVHDTERLLSTVIMEFDQFDDRFIKIEKKNPFKATIFVHPEGSERVDVDENECEEYDCFEWHGYWVYEHTEFQVRSDLNGTDWIRRWTFFAVEN